MIEAKKKSERDEPMTDGPRPADTTRHDPTPGTPPPINDPAPR